MVHPMHSPDSPIGTTNGALAKFLTKVAGFPAAAGFITSGARMVTGLKVVGKASSSQFCLTHVTGRWVTGLVHGTWHKGAYFKELFLAHVDAHQIQSRAHGTMGSVLSNTVLKMD